MRTTIIQQAPRFSVKPNKYEGILNYDADNAYPQRVADIVQGSAVAAKCTDIYSKFICGKGFADTSFYKAIINSQCQTVDSLLRKVAGDMALYRGFALHLNFNANGKIASVSHIPFEHCRLVLPVDEEASPTQVAVYDDWNRRRHRTIKKERIDTIDLFNGDGASIESQAKLAGGYKQYKGQVFWYSANIAEYPSAVADPVLEDCVTDAEIKAYKWRSVSTNFMASHIFINRGQFESDAARAEMLQSLAGFQGSDNAGKLMLIESLSPETDPEIVKVDMQSFDSQFAYTEQSVQENIRLCYGIPSVLIGKEVSGKLGTADEIEQAVNYYAYQTVNERLIIEEAFTSVFTLFSKRINPTNNYYITPLKYEPATIGI